MTTFSTAGTHLTVLGSPYIGSDGTVWCHMTATYNTGGGTVPAAPSSGSVTEFKAPFLIWFRQIDGIFTAQVLDGTNSAAWFNIGLPNIGTYSTGILLNGPAAFDGAASAGVYSFYQRCF